MSQDDGEWLISVAVGEFGNRVRKKQAELAKGIKKKDRLDARDFNQGLLESWFGYLRTGSFPNAHGLKAPVEFLSESVKDFQPHYEDKQHWRAVKQRMTEIILKIEQH